MFYKLVSAYTRQFSFPRRGLKYFLRLAKWLNIADKTYTKKLPGNFYMLLNPTEHIQQQLFWYGYYEKELADLIGKMLKPGDVFLDIGANIGYFSLLAASKDPTCKVIAFEPAKDIFGKLKENITINHFKNIITVNTAVGEKSEEKVLFLSRSDNLGMSSFRQPENFSGETEKVKVVSIDDWIKIAGLHKIDLIKIDVEGSEMTVLKGMMEVLGRCKPSLVMEINPETLAMFDLKAADIINVMAELKFEGFEISKDSNLVNPNTEVKQTKNFVFIHPDKIQSYSELINR